MQVDYQTMLPAFKQNVATTMEEVRTTLARPQSLEVTATVYRLFHNIGSAAALMQLTELSQQAREAEYICKEYKDTDTVFTESVVTTLTQAAQAIALYTEKLH